VHSGILTLPRLPPQSYFWHSLNSVHSDILPIPCLPQQPLPWGPNGLVEGTQSAGGGSRGLGFRVSSVLRSQATNPNIAKKTISPTQTALRPPAGFPVCPPGGAWGAVQRAGQYSPQATQQLHKDAGWTTCVWYWGLGFACEDYGLWINGSPPTCLGNSERARGGGGVLPDQSQRSALGPPGLPKQGVWGQAEQGQNARVLRVKEKYQNRAYGVPALSDQNSRNGTGGTVRHTRELNSNYSHPCGSQTGCV
jgi:hypothetical protein